MTLKSLETYLLNNFLKKQKEIQNDLEKLKKQLQNELSNDQKEKNKEILKKQTKNSIEREFMIINYFQLALKIQLRPKESIS